MEYLRIEKETDYLKRCETYPEKYTQEKFYKKMSRFGTLSINYQFNRVQTPKQIYQA